MRKTKREKNLDGNLFTTNVKSIIFRFLQPKFLFIIRFTCQNLTLISTPICSLAVKFQEDIKSKIGCIFTFCFESLYKVEMLLMCFSKRLCQMKYGNRKLMSVFTSVYI